MTMRPLLAAALGCAALLAAGCNSSLGSYQCQDNSDCTSEVQSGGICEANARCSFADSECGVDGQRYGKGSGELSNQCVGAAQLDAGAMDDANTAQPDAAPSCTAPAVTLTVPGTIEYVVPEGCSTVSIEAFGAGGGGAQTGLAHDSGAGGGGASGIDIDTGLLRSALIAAGGGGGGSTDDMVLPSPGISGAGGGGGYASAVFTLAPGTNLIAVVGGGGQSNRLLAQGTGGAGGAPGGGAGADDENVNGMDAVLPWGGGGGAGQVDGSVAGNSTYGGGGGAEEDGTGGNSIYGGAGSAGTSSPACGISTFGGACSGAAGGGGGFFVGDTAATSTGGMGSAGSGTVGGEAAMGGPGKGGGGGGLFAASDGDNGMLIITPSE